MFELPQLPPIPILDCECYRCGKYFPVTLLRPFFKDGKDFELVCSKCYSEWLLEEIEDEINKTQNKTD